MRLKLWSRTVRNIVFRRRPYFAHLAVTHRCNLNCRTCRVREGSIPELDTAGVKSVIDRLDDLGVAALSFSGGGEPLLRPDIVEIVNHAAGKGLLTKLTSNGTLPLERYRNLLGSGLDEIAISVDGVEGDDLPHSHTGPKVLRAARFLHDHLPAAKRLTLTITVTKANVADLEHIVAYCTREFPRARLWLNPVVVGKGYLRSPNQEKVDPEYLDRIKSPNLATPEFYKKGCREYYERGSYNWGCLAGELFFDVKPNGDLWICQDQPSRTPLNLLDPDFKRKYSQADFSSRRECPGCTYSCYFITQIGFELRNYVEICGLWFKVTTDPGERCREDVLSRRWIRGVGGFLASRLLGRPLGGRPSAPAGS